MKIAITGNTGLIGSRFINLLKGKYTICPLSTSKIIDITNKDLVFESLEQINPSLILHFAAKTDVDACEKDKPEDLDKLSELNTKKNEGLDFSGINSSDWKGKSSAFAINFIGTKNLADFAIAKNIKLVYISTDFVFSGEKNNYVEDDIQDPINWYGKTKYFGEKYINNNLKNYLIVRLSYPYGYKSEVKKDFLWKMADYLQEKKEGGFVSDQIITPTFIDDIVYGLEFLINKNTDKIYHLVGSSFVSPYQIGLMLAGRIGIDKDKIKKIKREEYYRNRAPRPFKSRIKNDKLMHLGFKTKTFEQGLDIIGNTL